MRRRTLVLVGFCTALVGAVGVSAVLAGGSTAPIPASGGDGAQRAAPPVTLPSAAQPFALVSEANGRYVTAETGGRDGDAAGAGGGTLRAAATSVSARERFTVHTADLGASATLRSVANGRYVTVAGGGGPAGGTPAAGRAGQGTLQARASTAADDATRFELEAAGPGRYTLRSTASGRYVSTGPGGGSDRTAVLRAVAAARAGTRETYRLVPLPMPVGTPPEPGARRGTAEKVSVMSWNICSNVGGCPLFRATSRAVTTAVATAATDAFSPDVVMVQEFCEKDAGPLERALERRTGRAWDVRFAPIRWMLADSVKAQRLCDPDENGADRGAYGLALGLPGASTWSAAIPLTSPSTDEQRAALCATVESRALQLCANHFSSTSAADDPTGTYRTRQLSELLTAMNRPGYRTIFGGDLNLTPPAAAPRAAAPVDAMDPAYDAYEECDQSAYGGRRTGTPTYSTSKIDYIFGPEAATYRCRVAPPNELSDHRPIYATVTLPAS